MRTLGMFKLRTNGIVTGMGGKKKREVLRVRSLSLPIFAAPPLVTDLSQPPFMFLLLAMYPPLLRCRPLSSIALPFFLFFFFVVGKSCFNNWMTVLPFLVYSLFTVDFLAASIY